MPVQWDQFEAVDESPPQTSLLGVSWGDFEPIEETPEHKAKRAAAADELAQAKRTTALGNVALAGTEGVEGLVGGIARLPQLPLNIIRAAFPQGTQPLASPEMVKEGYNRVNELLHPGGVPPSNPTPAEKGAGEAGAQLLSGFTDPANIAALPAIAAQPEIAGRLFQMDMLSQTPQQIAALQRAKGPEQTTKAALELAAGLGMPAMIEAGLTKPTGPNIPDFTGRDLAGTPGAPQPRGEPAPAPETVSAGEALTRAQQMTDEATASRVDNPEAPQPPASSNHPGSVAVEGFKGTRNPITFYGETGAGKRKVWLYNIRIPDLLKDGSPEESTFSVPVGSAPNSILEAAHAKNREFLPNASDIDKANDEQVRNYLSSPWADPEALTTKLAGEMTEEQLKAAEPIIQANRIRQAQALKDAQAGKISMDDAVKIAAGSATKAKIFQDVFARLNRDVPEAEPESTEPERITSAAWTDDNGQVHYGPHHPGILEAASGKELADKFASPESRNTPAFGYQTDKRPFVPRDEAGPLAEKSGQKLEEFDVDPKTGKEQPHSTEIAAVPGGNKPLSDGRPIPTIEQAIANGLPMGARGAIAEYDANQQIIESGMLATGKKAKPAVIEALKERQNQVVENFKAASTPKEPAPPAASTATPVGGEAPVAGAVPKPDNATPLTPEQWENRGVKYARRADGTLKTKGEYTSEEWRAYTGSVIEAKLKQTESQAAAPAAEKVGAQVSKVAATEGQRPAKAVKRELVARLEKAIEDAPAAADVEPKASTDVKGKTTLSKDKRTKTTIEIPGDGTFTIWNTKEALQEVLDRAKRISTTAGKGDSRGAGMPRPTGNIPADVWVESSEPTHMVSTVQTVAGKIGYALRKGKPVAVEGGQYFLTSDGKQFTVTEPTTGLFVGQGETISKAIENATEKLKKAGPERLNEVLAEQIAKEGKRPDPLPITAPAESPIPEAPKIVGMGGAIPEEFEPTSQTATGIRNAKVDAERAKRGLPAAIQPLRRSFGEVWDRAMAMLDHDPAVTDNLLDSLRNKPRALTDVEDALLAHRQVDLHNEYGKATRDLAQAHDDGRADAVAEEKQRVARLSDQLLDLYNIGKKVGTETGRGLSARRMMVNEDFSLSQMELDTRAGQGGRPLTEDQRAEIQRLHEQIKSAEDAYSTYRARMETKLAEAETGRVIAEQQLRAAPKFDKRILAHAENIVSKMEAAAKPAADRLRERLVRMSAGVDPTIVMDAAIVASAKIARAGLDLAKLTDEMVREFGEKIRPLMGQIWEAANKTLEATVSKVPDPVKKAILKADLPKMKEVITKTIKDKMDAGKKDQVTWFVQKLARSLVEHGVSDRDELIDEVHKVLQDAIPGITRRETMDAISGYGDFKRLSRDEISVTLRGMKGEMQQVAKLEDIEARKPPLKSGVERREPTDEERRLIKQVNDAKRRYGITVTNPATQLQSALGARKTALRNQIADLEYEIAQREQIVKTKSSSPNDAELEALKAKREAVQAEHAQVFPEEAMSPEEQAKRAEASVARQIFEVQRQLKEGDIFPGGKSGKKLSTPEIEAKRAQLDALKQERQNLRDAIQPKDTPEEAEMRKIQQRRIALQKSITEAERRINTGDIAGKPATPKPELTAELEAMKGERDQLGEMLTKLQAAAKPRRTPEEIALKTLKTRLTNQIADYADKLAREDYSKRPRPTTAMDPEAQRLQAESERLKKQFQRGVALERLKRQSQVERAGDWLVKWRRGFILSGPITLAKLTSAAVQRMAITPIEEGIGAGLSKVLPSIANKAAREGGLNVKAEAKAITQAVTQGMVDAWKTLRTGQSDLDVLYGKEALVAPSAVDFFGHVHGALKAPVKRAEFSRSFEKRASHAIAAGVDVSDPLVQTRLVIESYKDANRSIFMQDNRVVTAYKRALQALEAPDKLTGKPTIGGKVAATAARVLLPIVKVPTNIVGETLDYSTGLITGSARLGRAFYRGTETLAPEEADIIMRQLKKGSLGAAVMALGFFNPSSVGGYYQPGEKRPKSDVKAGMVRVFGHDVPSYLMHNPLLETMQIGATIRRVADSKLHKGDKDPQGVPAGLMAAGMGLGEQVPFVREQIEAAKAFNPKESAAFFGELGKSLVVPQLVQWLAKVQDTDEKGEVRRKPHTALQHIETGIPYLRQRVPTR